MIGAIVSRCRERVADLASRGLAGARDERDLVSLLEAVWAAIDDALARGRAADAPAPACGAGCSTCCRVNVGTLAVEGAVIAAHLRATLAPAGAGERALALLAFHERVRWLEDRERCAERLVCPFVDAGGRCTIHPVRPLACRGVSSLDAAACRRALSGGYEDDDDDGGGLVRMDLLQKALYDEAFAALAEALSARGLEARRRDVSGMAAVFLADPGLATAFLGARPVPLT